MVADITEKQDILILPFNLAVAASAVQNFERDVRMHFLPEREWFARRREYIEDALDIILATGRNNEPVFSDHKQIVFSDNVKASNNSAIFLITTNIWYSNKLIADISGHTFISKKPCIELFYC